MGNDRTMTNLDAPTVTMNLPEQESTPIGYDLSHLSHKELDALDERIAEMVKLVLAIEEIKRAKAKMEYAHQIVARLRGTDRIDLSQPQYRSEGDWDGR